MIIHQFFIPGIAHSSYLVAANRTCAVIDPERDAGRYIIAAREMGLRITHVLETHLHADFISGHLDLADATGAGIYTSRSAHCAFPHTPLAEGDEVRLEDIVVHHRDVLPPGNVAGLHLLRLTELPEDGIHLIVQSEHPEAIVVEIGYLRVHACFDEPKDILGEPMALGFGV